VAVREKIVAAYLSRARQLRGFHSRLQK